MNTISFPELWDLTLVINPVALQIGPISVFWYGVIIAVAFMSAVLLAMRDSRKFGLESENIIDLVLYAAPVAIVFARLYYVIFSLDKYKDDFTEIFKIWHGGLAIYGGVIGALLVAWFFARKRNIGIFKLLDFAVPYLALGQAIGRWGNFVNQEAFGSNTTLPWGMTGDQIRYQLTILQMEGMNVNPDMPVHPTFLYESLWSIGTFLFLIWYRKRRKLEGEVLFLYMIIYGIGRFWIEGLRTDSLMLGSLRVSQVLAFVLAIAFAIVFYSRRRKVALQADAVVEIGSSEYGSLLKRMKGEESEASEDDIIIESNCSVCEQFEEEDSEDANDKENSETGEADSDSEKQP